MQTEKHIRSKSELYPSDFFPRHHFLNCCGKAIISRLKLNGLWTPLKCFFTLKILFKDNHKGYKDVFLKPKDSNLLNRNLPFSFLYLTVYPLNPATLSNSGCSSSRCIFISGAFYFTNSQNSQKRTLLNLW